ncbi:ATP-binding cassette domain-containing protein [Sphingobacterium sp. DR205]|uniref:ATP-binding cassette domain-containing protein n=1 Tax=Sphingobacterium sp. DR205 TaxID=2713573 RepID=UPI0013E51143|nr:ATP-binding cassette domain-containing protein [Sphingobacterium sp. DR205]QIH33423.1 ATP-binding cassette domain-containing protein [Sphingobacterium sp. DR205]
MKNEDYSSHVADLFDGFKNFQLDSYKKNELVNGFVTKNRINTKMMDIVLSNKFNMINLINQFGVYMLLGIAMFLFPILFGITGPQIFSIVFILLFISAPIQRLLVQQQLYHRMKLSFTRVKELFTTLVVTDKDVQPLVEIEINKKERIARIQLENIEYKHANFKFGPVTLNIEEGQVVFVIGGNGSGKTTFLNILTNLYTPCAGNITINDRHKISRVGNYRDSFSAVFIDSKISRFNYGDFLLADNDDYKSWLRIFKMDNVVRDFTESALRRSFSKGQEKRVLLILALLENKQFLVLDEWAADQDPQFRKYFYEVIVPLLKSKGKTVIAVSHDDKYFDVADRIVKFEEGKIAQDLNAADWYKYKEIL